MSVCESCESSLGCLGKGTPCARCSKLLCSTCAGNNALIPFDPTNAEFFNDLTKNSAIESYCKECYHEVSVLDYTKSYDDFEGATDQPATGITFLMVHGGGGSRAMFRPHARSLVERGYRCILMDLPGHGTLVDSPLTLDSCVEATAKVYKACGLVPETTVYVGASLGAYIGFYILDKLPSTESFCGAILMDCGQNVGPDCSLMALLGIWFLKMAAGNMSNKALMKAMMDVTKKSPANYKLVESVFGAGMNFRQGNAQTVCMHTVAPADHIPHYDFPILFFNGSEDYRDSETQWLSMCKDQGRSALKVYEGGDHFFTHDERFLIDLLDRMDTFAKQVASTKP
eukprot:scaffold5547_cov163-Amphora_coffeaeformis.AAC.9